MTRNKEKNATTLSSVDHPLVRTNLSCSRSLLTSLKTPNAARTCAASRGLRVGWNKGSTRNGLWWREIHFFTLPIQFFTVPYTYV